MDREDIERMEEMEATQDMDDIEDTDDDLAIYFTRKRLFFLVIIFFWIMYLDLINFRTINSNGKFILNDLLDAKLYKLNIDLWISLVSIPSAVVGTYLVTSYQYKLQKKDIEKKWKDEKNMNLKISYKAMNKQNADALLLAIKKFYDINDYIDLLWVYYFNFQESDEIVEMIEFHYNEQLNFLQILKEDFFYREELVSEIDTVIFVIEKRIEEIEDGFIESDSWFKVEFMDVIEDMFGKYFIKYGGLDMEVWFKFLAYVTEAYITDVPENYNDGKFNYFLDNPSFDFDDPCDHAINSAQNLHLLLGWEKYKDKWKDNSQYLKTYSKYIEIESDVYIRIRYI